MRDRSEASVTRGEGEQRRGPRPTRSRKLGLLLGLALFATLVLGVTLASAIAPTVTVEDASQVEYTTAMVKGDIDPQGEPTTYGFQYISEAQFQENLTNGLPGFEGAVNGVEGFTETAGQVSGELVGLQPGTTFHLRLFAENSDGPSEAVAGATFVTKAVAKPVVTIAAPSAVTGTSAHFEGTIQPGAPAGDPAAFDVQWRFECTPSCPGFLGGEISADSTTHTVSAEANGLEPNTSYVVNLIAENAGGPGGDGPQPFKTGQLPPVVRALYAGPVGSDAATLNAEVDPENAAVTYQFEWGTDANYGHLSPAVAQPLAGSENSLYPATASISGLVPGTSYHFRLVATNTETGQVVDGLDRTFTTVNEATSIECPNAEFRTGAGANLPDCRAYEQVSPVEKNGADVLGYETNVQAAANGERVTFASYSAFDHAEGLKTFEPYLGTRDGEGWSTSSLYPPQEGKGIAFKNQTPVPLGYSQDLDSAVLALTDPPPVPGAQPETENLYTRQLPAGPFALLTSAGTTSVHSLGFDAASQDFGRILFESPVKLTPDAPIDDPNAEQSEPLNLYESVNGAVQLVSILPNGEPAPKGGRAGGAFSESNGTRIRGGGINLNYSQNTISADGSRVFWTSPTNYQLYVRIDGRETIEVSASKLATPEPTTSATFQAATPSGSKVFFISRQRLTNDSTAEGFAEGFQEGSAVGDLYQFDVGTGTLTDLTVAESGTASVLGVLGASDDGSTIYFVASGSPLAPGAPSEATLAPAQEVNLYVRKGGETRYISTLSRAPLTGDASDWSAMRGTPDEARSSRLTPEGRVLLFSSVLPLTGYQSGGHTEFYRYDFSTNGVVCVTCNPRNPSASSGASLGTLAPEAQAEISAPPKLTNVLSENGNRVFFQTREALVPADTNGKEDVYEWESGHLHLISTGQSSSDSIFGDATPGGDDVFFTTRQQLVGQDQDQNVDMYDARVGGGLAAQGAPSSSPPCVGDVCHGESPPPPTMSPPSSAEISAAAASPSNCQRQNAESKRLATKSKGDRRNAKHASSPPKARRLRASANRLSRRAKQMSHKASACTTRHNQGSGK